MKATLKARLGAAFIAAGLVLAGCGGSNTTDEPATGDASVDTNATLRFGVSSGSAATLDPHVNRQSYGPAWYGQAYDTLIHMGRTGELRPMLATEWTFSDDGSQLTLKLRTDVKFSDGTVFNAAAVKANLERGKTVADSSVKGDLETVSSVEVVDDATVRLNLSTPNAIILSRLATKAGTMVSPAAMNGAVDLGVKPVGTGPYTLQEYKPGVSATYLRNDSYWGEKPSVAKIELTLFADSTAGINALTTGQIDMFELLDKPSADTVSSAGLKVTPVDGLRVEWVALDFAEKFKDPKVREALSMSLDRKAFADFVGRGSPTYQWVPDTSPYFDPALGDLTPFDPAKAKQLLAEAGYPDGFSFTLNYSARPSTQAAAEVMQEMWAKAGFKVKLEATDGATTVDKCYVRFECDALGGVHNTAPDFAVEAQDIVAPGGRRNLTGQQTLPEVMSRLAEAEKPGDDREAKLKALQSEMSKSLAALMVRADPTVFGTAKNLISFELDQDDTVEWEHLKMGPSA